jgi:protein-disulfide isomerase
MSKRNSQEAKRAARERLRAQREREAKRAKIKRQIVVVCSAIAVVAAAGGIGYAVVQANKPTRWEAAQEQKEVVAPANTSGKDGTTVVIGKDSAEKTLVVYEDPRCPVCAQFEQTLGPTIKKDLDAGKYKLQFVGASFLDKGLQGEGSRKALSALGAALNVSPEAFLEYKTALYSAKFHPEESEDNFKDESYLFKVADTVDALKDNKTFQNDVKNGTFDKWALVMSKKFDEDSEKYGLTGTPSLVMDGKKVTGSDGQNTPMTVEEFTAAIDKALKG